MKRCRALAGLLVFAAIWQWFSYVGNILFPPLEDIASAFYSEMSSGYLLKDIIASTIRVVIGVAISTLIAISLGLVTTLWKTLPDFLRGVVEFLRPVPPIAWTPVAIIAFGIGDGPAVAIVCMGSFFPIWFGVTQGLSEIKDSHLRAAYSLGCGRWLLITDIIFPSALPYVVHGLRLGAGLGWFCVVAAEMMGASSGLGYGIQLSSLNLEMEKLYVYLMTIGVIGFLSNFVLESLDTNPG